MGRRGKIIASTLLAGIIGGAGVSSRYLSKQTQPKKEKKERKKIVEIPIVKTANIAQKLEKVGYLVLKTEGAENDSDWNTLLKAYKKAKEPEDKFTLNKKPTKENLKKQCQKALNSDSEENINYSLAKRWCVKPESINDMLKRNNYRRLNPSNKGPDKAKWKEKVNLIKGDSGEVEKMGLKLNGNKDDVALLQDACKKLRIMLSKTYENKDFEKDFTQAKSWCSEKST